METAMAVEGFGVEAAFDRVPRRAQAPAIRQMMARGRASVLPRIVTAPSDEVYPCQQPDRTPVIDAPRGLQVLARARPPVGDARRYFGSDDPASARSGYPEVARVAKSGETRQA